MSRTLDASTIPALVPLVRAMLFMFLMSCGGAGVGWVAGEGAESCAPGAGEVALFEDAGFTGRCAKVGFGAFPRSSAFALDDAISSVLVGEGSRVVVCRDVEFGGACRYFDDDLSDFAKDALIGNDSISSVRVELRPAATCDPASDQVAVFSEAGFAGTCSILGIGDYVRSATLGIANDTASSIRLGSGVQAMACQHDDWGEPCVRLTGSQDLSSTTVGNDALSSLRVLPRGPSCFVRGGDPDRREVWDRAVSTCESAYPRILSTLETREIHALPIVMNVGELSLAGETHGRTVTLDDDADDTGLVVHELVHVVQAYPDSPTWLSEGIADYVRYELGYDTRHGCTPNESFTDGYLCAAALLRFVETESPGAIRRLHARLREVPFDGRLFDDRAESVDATWARCRDGACRRGDTSLWND